MADKSEQALAEALEEAAAVEAAAPDVQDVVPEAEPGFITLRMPRVVPYEEGFEFPEGNMDFGPAGRHASDHDARNIKFHAEGPGDGYAVVREDHPALDALMKRYPQVEMVDSNPEPVRYACPDCDREFPTKGGLKTHQRSHK